MVAKIDTAVIPMCRVLLIVFIDIARKPPADVNYRKDAESASLGHLADESKATIRTLSSVTQPAL
jgi:hypothetical protein